MALALEEVLVECVRATTEPDLKEEDVSSDPEPTLVNEKESGTKVRKRKWKKKSKKTFRGFKERCREKNDELSQLVKKIKVENEVLTEKNSVLAKRSQVLKR